jgi:hypothetical protein
MESQALQELVRKIFSDEETKAQFAANPESVLSKFSLTECEKKAVLRAQAKFGLIHSDSLQLSVARPLDDFWL